MKHIVAEKKPMWLGRKQQERFKTGNPYAGVVVWGEGANLLV